jgi:osmoprotectant transport system permease protein
MDEAVGVVHFLDGVFDWFTTSANWTGSDGIIDRSLLQIELSALVVVAAGLIGIGAGWALGRSKRGSFIAVNLANAARAVPSLALLTLLVTWPVVSLKADGFLASFLALVALAIPPILTNAYVAMREVDPDTVEAAKAVGMTGWQRFIGVEAPLAVPLTLAGLRTGTIEVFATATLAGYVGYNDLGVIIFSGLDTNQTIETFCGAVVVAVLAGLADLVLATTYRIVIPAHRRESAIALRGARSRLAGVARHEPTGSARRGAGGLLPSR